MRRPEERRGDTLRVITHSDPVTLLGTALALVLSLSLGLTGAASGVESLLAGLMVTTVSLVLGATARAERRFELRELVRAPDWLAGELTAIAGASRRIGEQRSGELLHTEARQLIGRLVEDLHDLSRGRMERRGDDYEHLLAATRTCQNHLQAVTNIAHETAWWRSDVGNAYWQANLEAMARGVRITRVFITDEVSPELNDLVEEQRQAGVAVLVAERRTLDTDLNRNFAVWDGQCGWEAQANARGETVANLFVVNEYEVRRLRNYFSRLVPAAES